MQSLLQFFPKRREDGKMATVPKGRFRKLTSARTRDILRKSVKVLVLTLVVVLCYRWNQRRRVVLDAVARDERMLNVERQVEGLRVLEVSRIEDEDPMSVYDQVMEPLPREGIRTGDAVKAADEAKAAPDPGEAPIEKRPDGEGADGKSDKNEITDTEKKEESDNLWDAAEEKETDKETKEKKEESSDVAAAKDPNPPEENKVQNAISETEEEEPEKRADSTAEEKDNTKNTESLPLEPPRPASPASNGLGALERAQSETREAPNEPANESLAVGGIEDTIGKLKDAIGGIKMKLDEMKPSSKMYNRGYENQPQAAVMVPGSPSTARELESPKRDPADGDSAGRFAGAGDDLIFGRREAGEERRQSLGSPWGWACVGGKCVKQERGGGRDLSTLNVCRLTCGPHGSLWPRPTGVTRIGESTIRFLFKHLKVDYIKAHGDGESLVQKAFDIFVNNLAKEHGNEEATGQIPPEIFEQKVTVSIVVSGADTRLTLETPEAYTLDVVTRDHVTKVNVFSLSVFGARHGLETLSQLIAFDEDEGAFRIASPVTLSDAPAFKYRGILLDTSRNFFSVRAIERTLDAMAANKLNTFHWHITDSHSFPMVLESLPKMAFYGAYSPQQVYNPADVRHLVEYGRVRGIRVLPEFDVPAHVGNGWQWAEKEGLGNLVICLNKEPWHSYCSEPPCGQLNVVNSNSFSILSKIYEEMVSLFGPLDLFHFGGDEVNLKCWNTTEEIVRHLEEQGRGRGADSFYKLWSDFQERAFGLLTTANGGKQIPGILWTSDLTLDRRAETYLDRDHYVIQIWTTKNDAVIRELLEAGFRVIFSNYDHWYLDCGFGGWVNEGNNWCSPYKGWQKVYDNSPHAIATDLTGAAHEDLILGGEAALWGEQVDDMTLDSRLWPRGAALAERLWTNPSHNWEPAETRLIHQRQRMVARGVRADRVQPEWCHQNEGHCYKGEI